MWFSYDIYIYIYILYINTRYTYIYTIYIYTTYTCTSGKHGLHTYIYILHAHTVDVCPAGHSVDEADSALATNCGPKVSSAEEWRLLDQREQGRGIIYRMGNDIVIYIYQ